MSYQKEFLTDYEAANYFGISKATIWKYAKDPKFPQPVKIGPGATRWKLSDLKKFAKNLNNEK